MREVRSLGPLALSALLAGVVYAGCSSKPTGSGFATVADAGPLADAAGANPNAAEASVEEPPVGFDDDGGGGAKAGCVNLQCKQLPCQDGSTTTLSGVVYDPAARNPLYNVIVYVPNQPLEPITDGVTCDQCGVLTTGAPIATALTGPDGKFTLENVPSGADIPLVMQIGKWRRQVTIPNVEQCKANSITDRNLTRLPKNQSEGNLPKIAIATGGCDPFECLLRNVGVDDAEFTDPGGTGRINLFKGTGGGGRSANTPPATDLWSNGALMKQYDIIINSCECGEHPETKPEGSIRNMYDYANAGGRVFGSHYQYYWIDPSIITPSSPAPWKNTANFVREGNGPGAASASIDMSFPKGDALASWLVNVSASTVKGEVSVEDLRYNVTSVNPPSTRWVHGKATDGSPALFFYTFNTPTEKPEAEQCGKVLFSDFHVAGSSTAGVFPAMCSTNNFTNQQKALEFMLFDLSSCVQKDTDPVKPPAPQ